MFHVSQSLANLIGDRPEVAPAGSGVDRPHSRKEDVLADANARRVRRLALRETLSLGLVGSITVRESCPVIVSGQRHAFDLDLAATAELGAADRARGRVHWKELAVDLVHVVVLQHRVDQHVDLDRLGK